MAYAAPINDIRFALEAAGLPRLGPSFPELDAALLEAILDGAAAMAGEVLEPLNAVGDRAGATLEGDRVRTPPGFPQAYAAFAAGGWQGLAVDPAWGGQGLPKAVAFAVFEMAHAANLAFSLAPLLTFGAVEALLQHGSPALRQAYLPKLVSGEWTGTMNLTEPQAGSDVGALAARAEPLDGETYAITGQKIYITWGEHDLTENIVHLVLARAPGAPAGSKGLTLFLAPKILPDGARNALRCIGLERKMGLHASPTCTMAFEGAKAWRIGGEGEGMAAMFTMMNSARLNVGLEGVGVAEAATQAALAHAETRVQGRAEGVEGAVPLARHPDVARMLALMKAKTMAGRAMAYSAAIAADEAERAEGAPARAAAQARVDLLTPIVKAWCTDMACEVASLGVQVHGGAGFVEGIAAQLYRDARILPIYEGTNGIQAIDLVGRKLRGGALEALLEEGAGIADACRAAPGLEGLAQRLEAGLKAVTEEAAWLRAAPARQDVLAGASPFLRMAGDVTGGMFLARGALAAPAYAPLARFYGDAVLSVTPALSAQARIGAALLFAV